MNFKKVESVHWEELPYSILYLYISAQNNYPVGASMYEKAKEEYPEYFEEDEPKEEDDSFELKNKTNKKDRQGGNNRKKVKRKKRNKRRNR